jgi:hypothetical protein
MSQQISSTTSALQVQVMDLTDMLPNFSQVKLIRMTKEQYKQWTEENTEFVHYNTTPTTEDDDNFSPVSICMFKYYENGLFNHPHYLSKFSNNFECFFPAYLKEHNDITYLRCEFTGTNIFLSDNSFYKSIFDIVEQKRIFIKTLLDLPFDFSVRLSNISALEHLSKYINCLKSSDLLKFKYNTRNIHITSEFTEKFKELEFLFPVISRIDSFYFGIMISIFRYLFYNINDDDLNEDELCKLTDIKDELFEKTSYEPTLYNLFVSTAYNAICKIYKSNDKHMYLLEKFNKWSEKNTSELVKRGEVDEDEDDESSESSDDEPDEEEIQRDIERREQIENNINNTITKIFNSNVRNLKEYFFAHIHISFNRRRFEYRGQCVAYIHNDPNTLCIREYMFPKSVRFQYMKMVLRELCELLEIRHITD